MDANEAREHLASVPLELPFSQQTVIFTCVLQQLSASLLEPPEGSPAPPQWVTGRIRIRADTGLSIWKGGITTLLRGGVEMVHLV